MAHIIDPQQIERQKPGAQPRYPWETWTDGQWRAAVHGEDFDVPPKSFRSCLYHHARTHGFRVHTRLIENGIAFSFSRDLGLPAEQEEINDTWGLNKGN